jgi:choline-sulfatase
MSHTNVLIILSDEHKHDLMGCAGHPFIKTPALDELAEHGTRFTNAYTPSPICVPARASLATGLPVHENRCWDNAIAYDGSTPGWAQFLSDNGLIAESIGKLHYKSETAPVGFRRQQHVVHIHDGIGQVWGSVRNPLPENMGRSPIFDSIGEGMSNYNKFDMRVADTAAEWLAEHAHDAKPWVLFVGLVAPHFPLVVPERYLKLYDPAQLELPALHPSTGYERHPWVERQAAHMDHDAALGTNERRRLALASYYGLVSFMDEQVGKIIGSLKKNGLAGSTTVVYSSDHGDNLGKRGMWNKGLLYRESTGVPMIISGPDIPANSISATPVSLIDVQNTVLQCVGIESAKEASPGKSLVEIATSPDDLDRFVLSEYHAIGSEVGAFMLANSHYKYHYYLGMKPELFDVQADPEELHDLVDLPKYSGLLKKLDDHLRSILNPENVDAQAKADQKKLIDSFGGRNAALQTGTPAATPVPSA